MEEESGQGALFRGSLDFHFRLVIMFHDLICFREYYIRSVMCVSAQLCFVPFLFFVYEVSEGIDAKIRPRERKHGSAKPANISQVVFF